MECQLVMNYLSEYMDKGLHPDLLQDIAEHIKECPNCEERLTLLNLAEEFFTTLEEVDLPEGYSERVEKLIQQALENRE
jgi:predicted anti-sigma-YlaC factor YlaD